MGFQLYRSSPIPLPPSGATGDSYRLWAESVTDELNSLSQTVYDVREFGARGDGITDDTDAIQGTIDSVTSGGAIWMPAGIYRVTEPILLQDKRSTRLYGDGFGHTGKDTGTIIRWDGGSSGTVLHLKGVSQSAFQDFAIDGASAASALGIHVERTDDTATQYLTFNRIRVSNCTTGMQIGVTGANQTNNSDSAVNNLWFQDNDVGVLFQGDQSANWRFHNLAVLNGTAGIRTGGASPNRGNFQVAGGLMSDLTTVFDIPSVTGGGLHIRDVHIERVARVMDHNTSTGDAKRTILLENLWQNSNVASATTSVIFKTSNSLVCIGCNFIDPVEVDNNGGGLGTPHRTFISSELTVEEAGPTAAYVVNYIGDTKSGVGLHTSGATARVGGTHTPASGTASGVTGDITWDTSYAYVCTSTDSWSRATLNTF